MRFANLLIDGTPKFLYLLGSFGMFRNIFFREEYLAECPYTAVHGSINSCVQAHGQRVRGYMLSCLGKRRVLLVEARQFTSAQLDLLEGGFYWRDVGDLGVNNL